MNKVMVREVMEDPKRWPRWPYLPLKRYRQEWGVSPEVATLYANKTGEGKWLLLREGIYGEDFRTALDDPARQDRFTMDEIIEEGWVID